VVEDHDFVREEIVALLNRQSDLICCGQADSIDSTVAVVAEQAPDVVLLDLRLKNADAFDLISSLRYQFPRLVILVLSQCDEVLAVRKALRAGAQGYVTKHEATDELLVGLRAVLGGELYVSRALALRLLRSWLVDRRVDQ
jgi:DNA-binding NarL/FixJ family response regulator